MHEAGRLPLDLPDCVEAMAREGVVSADHIPVIASLIQDDAALMGCPGTPAAGTVARARGDVIDRRTDFPDYYLAQLEYNKQSTEFIKKRYGPKPEGVPHAVLINRARTAPAPGSPTASRTTERNTEIFSPGAFAGGD